MLAEALFGLVFIGALVGYLRRRDSMSRDVTLALGCLASLLAVEIVRRLAGDVPFIVTRAAFVFLLAHPIFTFRLLREMRSLPRWLLPAVTVLYVVTAVPVLLVPNGSALLLPAAFAAFGSFVMLDLVAGGMLLAEARRRTGSGQVRLYLAGVATLLVAVAFLLLLTTLFTPDDGPLAVLSRLAAVAAALCYGATFLSPGVLRRSWQAGANYRFGRRLLESADARDPALAWQRYVELARELTEADAAVVRGADGTVRAAVGVDPPPTVGGADVRALLDREGWIIDCRPAEIGEPWAGIAATVNARYMTVVPVASGSEGEAGVLLLYSRRRTLFAEDDRELLVALGAQAAILADRASLAADLHRTVEQLQSANAAKSDFLASMSHELRTPLNAIIGFSELMRMEAAGRGRVEVPAEWVEHVAAAGQHLLDLINDVLDLAKVEAGRLDLDLTPFDLDSSLVEWIGGIRPLADRKSIRLHVVGEAATIRADRGRMRQVLYNLLSNAIKFTPERGEIRVEVRRVPGELHLAVVDTGIGIAPEDHAVVFEEFRQVGEASQRQPGTGLGLALSRRLVEAHGGRIEVESKPGDGARFTIVLPQSALPAPTPAPLLPTDDGIVDGGDVLVVEDDPGAVRLLRDSLEGAGWRVRAASDGNAALAAARERPPDAIVLDVMLPGMDGWDVLRALKADPDLRDVAVLMLTVVDEREIGLALGAADYLVKPVDRTTLLDRLGRQTFTTKVRHGEIRVLVVDDDPAAVDVVSVALEQEGFSVDRAFGGRQALQIARARPPNVVICDLVMPDVDGFELVAELKADPRTREAPILIVTAHDISDVDKARLNGHILGIVAKGDALRGGLRQWLARMARRRETETTIK